MAEIKAVEEERDLYLVVCREDRSYFLPPTFFGVNSFTESKEKFYTHVLEHYVCEWRITGNDNFKEVADFILSVPKVKNYYLSQPYDSPALLQRNMHFFETILKRISNERLFIVVGSSDKTMNDELALYRMREKSKLSVLSFSKETPRELKKIFLICKPPPAPQPVEQQPLSLPIQHVAIPQLQVFEGAEDRHQMADPLPPRPASQPEIPSDLNLPPISASIPHQIIEERKAPSPRDRSIQYGFSNVAAGAPLNSFASLPAPRSEPKASQPSPERMGENAAPDIQFSEEDFRCCICMCIFRDPLSCELCGSIVCKICSQRLTKCPQCRRVTRMIPSKALNRIFSGMKEKCACGEVITARGLEEHQKVCVNRKYQCRSCGVSLEKEDFVKHLKTIHMEEILRRYDRVMGIA